MRVAMWLLAVAGFTCTGHAQEAYVTGAPYTAEMTSTVDGDRHGFETVKLARASDGSTYRSVLAMGKVSYRASIADVPNHRVILLDTRAHTYTIKDDPAEKVVSAEDFKAGLGAEQAEYAQRPTVRLGSAGTLKRAALGTKVENGFTLYGSTKDDVQPPRQAGRVPFLRSQHIPKHGSQTLECRRSWSSHWSREIPNILVIC